MENGIVLNFDTRTLANDLSNTQPPRFTLAAHDGAASALDVNPHIPGCIVTGGTDKIVKVWNVAGLDNGGKREVSLVTSRDLGVVCLLFASQSMSYGADKFGDVGQSILCIVLARRSAHARSGRLKSTVADLGRRGQCRCTQGVCT